MPSTAHREDLVGLLRASLTLVNEQKRLAVFQATLAPANDNDDTALAAAREAYDRAPHGDDAVERKAMFEARLDWMLADESEAPRESREDYEWDQGFHAERES